jgi:hypothetical protein
MPENVVFTKRDEASKYASEVDGQVVGDDAGWRVMGIGYHEGGAVHDHPHLTKGQLVTRIMRRLGESATGTEGALLALSKAKLEEKDRKIAEKKAQEDLAKEVEEQQKTEERAREYLERTEHAAGGIVDELGYMHGGMPHGKRDPIKYAAGGAVRGKRFVGTF